MFLAICDDEPKALEKMKETIQSYIGPEHTIEVFDDPDKFLLYAQENMIQVVFMDIELGEKTGIDTVSRLMDIRPKCQVVYVTNYMDYVTDVYRTPHTYFLFKNELAERLPEVMEKIRRTLQVDNTKLILVEKSGTRVIRLDEIRYVETAKRVTKIHTQTEVIGTRERIDDIAQRLPEEMFIRCHKSFLISPSCVKKYERQRFTLDRDEVIPISRAHAQAARQAFMNWAGML